MRPRPAQQSPLPALLGHHPLVDRPLPCASCPLKNLPTEESPRDRKRHKGLYGSFCDKLRSAGECFHEALCRSRARPPPSKRTS